MANLVPCFIRRLCYSDYGSSVPCYLAAVRIYEILWLVCSCYRLEKPVKSHLTRVYGALSMACLVCTAGVFCTLQGFIPEFLAGNFLFVLGIFGMTMALVTMEATPHNQDTRMALFMGIAAMMGTYQLKLNLGREEPCDNGDWDIYVSSHYVWPQATFLPL